MAKSMIESALWYRRKGFSVIPCKKDKTPFIKWQPYQLQKPTEDEIREWWGKWPNANIGLPCGPVSGVDVLDVDTEEAYENLTEFFLSDSFQTPIAKTPKGRHLYFKHRTGLSNAVRVVAGTDLRTLGGYVIAPPSMNGGGVPYYWLEGLKISKVDFAEWPAELFAALQQGSSNLHPLYSKGGVIGGGIDSETENIDTTKTTTTTNGNILFESGQRDNDLFHIANCLIKGGCETNYTHKVLEILAKNCVPPFDQSEISAKIHSALTRKASRERNLAFEVKEWVDATFGNISATDGYKELHLTTKTEKKNFNMIMKRLSEMKPPLVERSEERNGVWRKVEEDCQPVDWLNTDCKYIDLWLPLGIGEVCGVQPGNVLMYAGAKDSGKTAFLMNIAKENRFAYKVHYINSEMSRQEFKMRMSKFDDVSIEQLYRDINLYNASNKFQDRIKSGEGNLNIIDYLEVPDEAFRIGPIIKKIHEKLDGALCVIGIQKKINQDLGRGAEFSLEKARLYLSLDYGKAKIISCKNFKDNEIIKGNPRGYTTTYKLVNGCKIIRSQSGWTSPGEKEKNNG